MSLHCRERHERRVKAFRAVNIMLRQHATVARRCIATLQVYVFPLLVHHEIVTPAQVYQRRCNMLGSSVCHLASHEIDAKLYSLFFSGIL